MSIETVAVTGGNGKVGSAILEELNEYGYRTVNVARGKRREEISDEYRMTDILDAGEVYGSLARSEADAVVHMGTIPHPRGHPGYVTYESNVMSSYHVLEAATELGLESICLASSINAIGSAFQDAPTEVRYLPVDEEHPLTPRDPYGIAKHTLEVTADGFGRLPNAPTIATLRYPWVATTEELDERFASVDRTSAGLDGDGEHHDRNSLFSYVHIDDAAAVARSCVEATYSGHETFWAVASDTSADVPSERLAATYYPDADRRDSLEGNRSLIDTTKARSVLGWEPMRTWRE